MITMPRANFLRVQRHLCIAILAAGTLVLSAATILGGTLWAAGQAQLSHDVSKLPPEVQRMRQAILQAATSGDIEELRGPIEMNEIHPVFGKSYIADPIAYLKSVSADGNGRDMLAVLYNLLTTGYAIVNPGTNEEMFVWPYHAAIPLGGLSPGQEVEIYRFLSPARFKEMAAEGRYGFYSVGIGRDGVWHYFSLE